MAKKVRPEILLDRIDDQYVRANFKELSDYFSGQNQLLNFKFFEVVFTEATTGFKRAHGLSSVPLDIIVTHITGTGYVTFKHGLFTTEEIVMDASGPCRVRFFAGTYFDFTSPVQNATSDTQKVSGV